MKQRVNDRKRAYSTVIKLIFEGWSEDVPHCLSCVGSCLGLGNAGWLPNNGFEDSPFRATLGRSRSVSSLVLLGVIGLLTPLWRVPPAPLWSLLPR